MVRIITLDKLGEFEASLFKNKNGFMIINQDISIHPVQIYASIMDKLQDFFLEKDYMLKIVSFANTCFSPIYLIDWDKQAKKIEEQFDNHFRITKFQLNNEGYSGSIGYVNKRREDMGVLFDDKSFFYFNSGKNTDFILLNYAKDFYDSLQD